MNPTVDETVPGPHRALIELFLASFLILFFELTCIRWFGSVVLFLTFFTNVVLMACFLGVSVGCLSATRRWDFIQGFIPGILVAVALAYAVLWIYFRFDSRLMIDVGGQKSPQLVYFGADSRVEDPARLSVPVEAIAGVFFVLIAMVFVGPGQVVGRRFAAIPDRLAAYTADILGSLAGIAAFGAASLGRLPSTAWFALCLALGLYFTPRRRWLHAAIALGTLYIVATRIDWPDTPPGREAHNSWSPYNFVSYKAWHRGIDVNNLAHQRMLAIEEAGAAYMLPYLLNRDAGGRPFEDVLIIGAGSGNDVAAALRQGAEHVNAVEIDPVIAGLGRRDHPDRPYSDPRVTIHNDDGRGFVRKTTRRYDLVIYALVNSLALHSSYSSLRLESFLFTEEAFRDIRAHLKPGGVFAMYNYYRQGWVVGRLVKLAETVFGAPPIVFSLPAQETIAAEDNQRGFITFLLAAPPGTPIVDAIGARLARDRSFWLNTRPILNESINGYGPAPPTEVVDVRPSAEVPADSAPPEFQKIAAARVERDVRRPHPDRRLAVPVPAPGDDPGIEPPRHGDGRGALDGDPLPLRAGPPGAAQRPDVLPGRRVHAAGDQGRRAHGLALQRHMDGQLDRVFRHPDHGPAQQSRGDGVPAPSARAVLRDAAGRPGGQSAPCRCRPSCRSPDRARSSCPAWWSSCRSSSRA